MFTNRQGFTLIEILAAMFIFFVLITTLFSSFRVLTSSSSALGTGSLQVEMAQECISRIVTDMEAIYVNLPPAYRQPETGESPDSYRIEGESDYKGGKSFARIRFASLSHVSFDKGGKREGVAEIVYYVTPLDDGEYVLRRSDHLYPYEPFEEKETDPIVCKNVQSFTATYYDSDGGNSETWDSDSSEFNFSTPRSIGILLKVGDEDAPIVLTTRVYIQAYREKKV